MGTATTKEIADFFGMKLGDMKREWLGKDHTNQPIAGTSKVTGGPLVLTKEDKAQITAGLTRGPNGEEPSYTY